MSSMIICRCINFVILSQQYMAYDEDLSAVVMRAIEIVNQVDMVSFLLSLFTYLSL